MRRCQCFHGVPLFPPDFLRLFAAKALDHAGNLANPLCSSIENVTIW
jgi:hypothetical protein